MGHIWYFLLEDWVQVTEFKHVISIKAVFPDMVGTRLIFIDAKSDGYIFNPVSRKQHKLNVLVLSSDTECL